MRFYEGFLRPLTEADVESLHYPHLITAPVHVFKINGRIILGTSCHRLDSSRVILGHLNDFVLPDGLTPIQIINPTEEPCVNTS